MAKQVVFVTRENRQPHKFAMEKEVVEIECDDGSSYIFERTESNIGNAFRLARRVSANGAISLSKAQLPREVKKSIEATVSGWYK